MSHISSRATVYGYPRQGADRELKKAIEAYWAGRIDADALLRRRRRTCGCSAWPQLRDAGLDEIPSNDFSLYDHVLDTTVAARRRSRPGTPPRPDVEPDRRWTATSPWPGAPPDVDAAGDDQVVRHQLPLPGPRAGPGHRSRSTPTKPVAEFARSLAARRHAPARSSSARSPILLLAKPAPGVAAGFDPLDLLDRCCPVYAELLAAAARGRRRVGPAGRTGPGHRPPPAELDAVARAYATWRGADRPARRSWSPPTSTGSATRCRCWPRPGRGPRPGLHRPGRRQPATTSPPSAGCPASGWSPGWSTAATSGSPT